MRNRQLYRGVRAVAVCAALLGALAFAGCNRGKHMTIAEMEAAERSSRLYANAVDDMQAGRLEAAIKGFERVVLEEPKRYSAHFQLATLLQDVRKDYIAAICHYRAYLQLRPSSDKATVANVRVEQCERALTAEVLRRAGGSASNQLAAEKDKLAAECQELSAKLKKAEGELAKAQKEIKRLEGENESKRRIIAKLGEVDDVGDGSSIAKSLKDAIATVKEEGKEAKRRRLQPTDAELLDEDDTTEDRIRNSVDIKNLKREVAAIEAENPPPPTATTTNSAKNAKGMVKGNPFDALAAGRGKQHGAGQARPETYTVQDGDTLFKISQRFYNTSQMWRKIQDANRAIIPADGRLRAGQVIKLPQP